MSAQLSAAGPLSQYSTNWPCSGSSMKKDRNSGNVRRLHARGGGEWAGQCSEGVCVLGGGGRLASWGGAMGRGECVCVEGGVHCASTPPAGLAQAEASGMIETPGTSDALGRAGMWGRARCNVCSESSMEHEQNPGTVRRLAEGGERGGGQWCGMVGCRHNGHVQGLRASLPGACVVWEGQERGGLRVR